MKHVDLAGNEISVGQFVVYAALWDRSAVLKYGIVTALKERRGAWSEPDDPATPTLRIISVDRHTRWDGSVSTEYWKLQNEGKDVTLGFLDRCIAIRGDSIPDEALQILSTAFSSRDKQK